MKRLLFLAAVGIVLTACTTTRYVEVIEHQTDTLIITKHQLDSIYMKDSTNVHEWQKGDTMYIEVLKWHTKYVTRETHDTLYQATHDTIPAPYPVTEYVEKQLTGWQRFRLSIANVVLYSLLIAAGIYLWMLYRKIRK